MTDCFALLDEPRRPWLAPEPLKQKFLTRSAAFHPDRVHNASEPERRAAQDFYTELNAAYQKLRDPKLRLQHLLELEQGARPQQVQSIPAELMNLGLEIGGLCREADALLQEKAQATSRLQKANLFTRAHEAIGRLTGLQRQLNSRHEQLITQLKSLDAQWNAGDAPGARATLLPPLEALYRLLSYFERWSEQVQPRVVQLSLD